MSSPFCLDRTLLGVRQDGACSFCPKPTCPSSPAAPPSATASPAAPAHWSPSGSQVPCPAPSPRDPPPGTPSVSSQSPSGPSQLPVLSTHRLQIPPTPLAVLWAPLLQTHQSPHGTWTTPGTLSTQATPKGDPVTTVPTRDSSARAPRECPHLPREQEERRVSPWLTSRATRPLTALLRLSGSPEAWISRPHPLRALVPGAEAVQEDAGLSQGTSCQPRPAGQPTGTTDRESQVCRQDAVCGSPVFCPQRARSPGRQGAAQGPQGLCGLTLSCRANRPLQPTRQGQSRAGAQRTACPARPEGKHAGEASAAAQYSLTACLGNRTRSRRTPAQLVPNSFRVPPLHAALPARHHPTSGGLGLLVAK